MNTKIIFDFSENTDLNSWRIVDDVVMGGRSSGSIKLNAEGHGVFEGTISLENNGGFSSVRHSFDQINLGDASVVVLSVKGDGKKYQFRIKANADDYYYYIFPFVTSGGWEEVRIPLKEMYPSFRGRKLDLPNFSSNHLEEVAFLIGNKKNESFKLIIDSISLE